MNRSTHDKRNKTETCFHGWDHGEITEWLEVKDESNRLNILLYKIKLFWSDICKSYKTHFGRFRWFDDEEISIEQLIKNYD